MLKFENVSKFFDSYCAVSNLSFQVQKGQVMGLLGPNGAGKSTSMKMAVGFLKPSSGKISILGNDVWQSPRKAKSYLGYLPERAPLYEDLTCVEYLSYFSGLKGIPRSREAYEIDAALDACYLDSVRAQAINTLSKGYRHRLCLAQSLLGNPAVLIFDEPTDGLDPNQKREIRDLIKEIRQDKAIVISTHILEEVESVCTDVFIINRGEKVFSGTPDEMRAVSENRGDIKIELSGGLSEPIVEKLSSLPEVEGVLLERPSREGGAFVLSVSFTKISKGRENEIWSAFFNDVIANGYAILDFTHEKGQIAQSFRKLTFSQNS